MATWRNTVFWGLLLLLMVGVCLPVCVEVPSGTEAVQGHNMTLLCISCMQREEVFAITSVEWYYQPPNGNRSLIFEYIEGKPREHKSPFKGRLQWIGSKDLQDVSIILHNVTFTDSGRFICNVNRTLHFEAHQHSTMSNVEIDLIVSEIQKEDFTSVLSEIMMYILLAFLTLWLLIEVVYCYRKISKAEEVTQESVTDYLAIPSENKEHCPVQVEDQ
ncbi:sodium channel subunit beta-3 [Bufo bufo]|uniref:sodium channel subunit beta-3 n=1 Tax=Bufo bufo TaxID=8384 RepID=UPI001ABDB48F|nr:sodium channel subunit beta-3 [Bufo bufo]XP_040287015.1 sodium channel subunit beta-3 [Bufo bufo]